MNAKVSANDTDTRFFMYDDYPLPIRPDLSLAHQRAWLRLPQAGTWLDGTTRVAIAREVRQARSCRLW